MTKAANERKVEEIVTRAVTRVLSKARPPLTLKSGQLAAVAHGVRADLGDLDLWERVVDEKTQGVTYRVFP